MDFQHTSEALEKISDRRWWISLDKPRPQLVGLGLLLAAGNRALAGALTASVALGPSGRTGMAVRRAAGRRCPLPTGRVTGHLPGGRPRRLHGHRDARRPDADVRRRF